MDFSCYLGNEITASLNCPPESEVQSQILFWGGEGRWLIDSDPLCADKP